VDLIIGLLAFKEFQKSVVANTSPNNMAKKPINTKNIRIPPIMKLNRNKSSFLIA
tara:strand:+ start:418 stop:582 length:165 start_codon:yes stop_codon:yes gene_type:complete